MIKNNSFRFLNRIGFSFAAVLTAIMLISCGESASSDSESATVAPEPDAPKISAAERDESASSEPKEKGSRDNTPTCLVPESPGTEVFENKTTHLDSSNKTEGYVTVRYTGKSDKVKLQITGPNSITYTYNLSKETENDEVFPLQSGNGDYMVNVFENIKGTQYSMVFTQLLTVNITNEFSPFLYPNQYVTFNKDSLAVKKGEVLAFPCNNDLDVVSEIYNFMINNIVYDHEEAETVQSGYLPDVDEVLATGTGICLDYAALMSAMLRSQRIPTRMEIGYAGTAYHAWISTYITDVGWVNGIIEFNGKEWKLMDPTFASNISEESLKEFIGDGENYSVKYVY